MREHEVSLVGQQVWNRHLLHAEENLRVADIFPNDGSSLLELSISETPIIAGLDIDFDPIFSQSLDFERSKRTSSFPLVLAFAQNGD